MLNLTRVCGKVFNLISHKWRVCILNRSNPCCTTRCTHFTPITFPLTAASCKINGVRAARCTLSASHPLLDVLLPFTIYRLPFGFFAFVWHNFFIRSRHGGHCSGSNSDSDSGAGSAAAAATLTLIRCILSGGQLKFLCISHSLRNAHSFKLFNYIQRILMIFNLHFIFIIKVQINVGVL